MDDSEQTKTVDEWGHDSATRDILQSNDTAVSPEALTQSAAEVSEPESMVSGGEPSQPQTRSKITYWLIALVAVFALGIVGGMAWLVFANGGRGDGPGEIADKSGEGENDNSGKEREPKPVPEQKLVMLSLDDELVQRLYEQFTNQRVWFGLLGDRDVSDSVLLNVAYSNVKRTPCRGAHDSVPTYHEEDDGASCYDGKAMRDKVYEIFGKTIEIKDGYGLSVWYCEGYTYDGLYDEFWHSGGGCSGTFTALQRALTGAEKNNDGLYLYEVAAYSKIVAAGREDDYMDWSYQGPIEARFYRLEEMSDQSGTWYQPGERIGGLVLTEDQLPLEGRLVTDNYAAIYLREYESQLDKFKWTFVWNGENYVFEKLERV